MTIFYLDSTGGSDAAAGTSWAAPWKTWANGPTAARIAPGDTIRIAKSKDPTSIGNAKWTNGPAPAATNINSSLALVPIRVVSANHGLTTDDVAFVTGHTTNTPANGLYQVTVLDSSAFTLNDSSGLANGGAAGTVRQWNANCILLENAVTKSISNCDKAWTAYDAAKCVVTTNAAAREGGYYNSLDIKVGAGVEALAYCLTDNTDFSSYTQLSFQIKSNVGFNNGDFQLRLCSDLTGTAVVNTIAIPPVYAGSYGWGIYTVDTSSALGSGIKSISLYQAVDKGALIMLLDNVIACKSPASADSLTLNSLISKDSTGCGGDEGWYSIMSITNKMLVIDTGSSRTLADTQNRGYAGDSTTTTTYKREAINIIGVSAGSNHFAVTESGSSGLPMTYSGGWDPATGLQDGETYYDGQNGFGQALLFNKNFIKVERVSMFRYSYGSIASGYYCDWTCTSWLTSGGWGGGSSSKWGCNVITPGEIGVFGGFNNVYNIGKITNQRQYGVYITGSNNNIFNINKIINNLSPIMFAAPNSGANYFNNIQISRSGGAPSFNTCSSQSLFNCKFDDYPLPSTAAGYSTYLYSAKHDGTADRHRIYSDGGITYFDTTSGRTGGPGWTCAPGSTRVAEYPFAQKMIKIAVPSGNRDVTASAYLYKTHATNVRTDLYIQGGQIGGIPNDMTFAKSDTTAWEQVTAVFRPSEAGTVEVMWRSWYVAGTANVLCDSTLNVSIAP